MAVTKMQAKVVAVLRADDPISIISRAFPQVTVEFGGMMGDRHFGLTKPAGSREPEYKRGTVIFNSRQLSIVFSEELAFAASNSGITNALKEKSAKRHELAGYEEPHLVLLAGLMGANILMEGVEKPTTAITEGSRIIFENGAGLISTGINNPCTEPGEAIDTVLGTYNMYSMFPKLFYGRRGIVAITQKPGVIMRGESSTVYIRKNRTEAD